MGYNAPTNTYDTIADLRLCIGQTSSSVTVLGKFNAYDSLGGTFLWDGTSNLLDDNYTVIQPTLITSGLGRWIRASSADAISGRIQFTGDGVTTIFTYSFPGIYSFLNNDYFVILQPLTAEAAIPTYIINKTSSDFDVAFTTPPPITSGGAIQFDYILRYTPNILEM